MGEALACPKPLCPGADIDVLELTLSQLTRHHPEVLSFPDEITQDSKPDLDEAYNIRNVPSVSSPPAQVESNPASALDFGLDGTPGRVAADGFFGIKRQYALAETDAPTISPGLPTPPNEILGQPLQKRPQLPNLLQAAPWAFLRPSNGLGSIVNEAALDHCMVDQDSGSSSVNSRAVKLPMQTKDTGSTQAYTTTSLTKDALEPQGILTPPADSDRSQWLSTIPTQPPPQSSSAPAPNAPHSPPPSANVIEGATHANIASISSTGHAIPWLQTTVTAVGSITSDQKRSDSSLRVLSQALPLPSNPGHNFPDIIEAVKIPSGPCPITFINVWHAIPGRSKLSDLPTSAPTTPGPALGGDDYFAIKVFDSAVPAIDYDNDQVVANSLRCALAAPSSLNLSIVERYIPPSSPAEVIDMYNAAGRSLLVDRLVELSPHNGCLTFIYPTLAGADTFTTKYLGPVLDPLLRSMVIRYDMCSDFSSAIGTMTAVDDLSEYAAMKRGVARLCRQLSQGSSKALHDLGTSSNFSVVHSQKAMVSLETDVWSHWWLSQEKSRIKNAIMKYYRGGYKLPKGERGQPEIHHSVLVHEVLSGVESRAVNFSSDEKIEVGVFVIKRGA